MKTQIKILFATLLVSSALGAAGSAFAAKNITTDLQLESEHIYGNCRLIVTQNEPYSHFNSNCNLDKNNITIYGHELPGYQMGYPRSTVWTKTWHLLRPSAPEANGRYCARFGIWGDIHPEDVLRVEWGHYSNPNVEHITTGKEMCKTAVPQVKAH